MVIVDDTSSRDGATELQASSRACNASGDGVGASQSVGAEHALVVEGDRRSFTLAAAGSQVLGLVGRALQGRIPPRTSRTPDDADASRGGENSREAQCAITEFVSGDDTSRMPPADLRTAKRAEAHIRSVAPRDSVNRQAPPTVTLVNPRAGQAAAQHAVACTQASAPRDSGAGGGSTAQSASPGVSVQARGAPPRPISSSSDGDVVMGESPSANSDTEAARSVGGNAVLQSFGLLPTAGPTAIVARPAVHFDLAVENRCQRVTSGGLWIESELAELSAEEREILVDLFGPSSHRVLALPCAAQSRSDPTAFELLEAAVGLAPLIQLFGPEDFAARCVKTVQALPLLLRHILDQRHLRGRHPRSESALAEELEMAITALRRAEASESASNLAWIGRLRDEVAAYEDHLEAQAEQHRVGLQAATERVTRRDQRIEALSRELERQRMRVEDLEGRVEVLQHALDQAQNTVAARTRRSFDVDALLDHLDARTLLRGNWIRLREILTSYHSDVSVQSARSTMIVVEALDLPRDIAIPSFVRQAVADSSAKISEPVSSVGGPIRVGMDSSAADNAHRGQPKNLVDGLLATAPTLLLESRTAAPSPKPLPAAALEQVEQVLSSDDVPGPDAQAAAAGLAQLRSPSDTRSDAQPHADGLDEYDFRSGGADSPQAGCASATGSPAPFPDADNETRRVETGPSSAMLGQPATSTAVRSRVLKRYPAQHQPSEKRPLNSDARFPLTLAKAKEGTPDAIKWEDVRLDVKELMLQGYSHGAAYQLVQEDKTLHDRFRADRLQDMLKTAIVFEQLDQTPWFRFVPTDLLDTAYAYATTPNFRAAYSWHPIPPVEEESADSDSSESAGDKSDPSFRSKAKSQRPLAAETRGRKRPAADAFDSDGSSGQPSPKKKKVLMLDDANLSDDELRAAQVTSSTSPWLYLGVRVAVSSARVSKSLSGFPMYAHVRRPESVATLDARWDAKAYRELLLTRPWETLWNNRVRHFFFYHEAVFSAEQKAVLGRVIRFMHDYAQEIWERLHWVHIPAEDSAYGELTQLGRRIHQSRKSRAAAMRNARAELAKEANEKLPTHIWYEPGLWAMPESGCEWILEHPKFKIPLETQLQTLDAREPIRACWTSGSYEEVCRHVSPTLANGRRTGPALDRHLIPSDPALSTEPLKELAITGGFLKRG